MEFTNYIPSLQDFIHLSISDAFSKKEITLQSQCAIKVGYTSYDEYIKFQYFIILNTYSLKDVTEEVEQLSIPNLKIKFSKIAAKHVDESIEDELKPIFDNTLQFSEEVRNSISQFETKLRMLLMECFIDNLSANESVLNSLKLVLIDAKKQFVLSDAETKNEIQDLLDYIESYYANIEEDADLVHFTLKRSIKAIIESRPLEISYGLEETKELKNFAYDLIKVTLEQHLEYMQIIKPKLKGWEAERIPILDMTIIKMAMSEMIHFATIPLKVTVNEYIDLTKLFCSVKSKDFVNGIMDRIMRDLQSQGKILKTGRGLD